GRNGPRRIHGPKRNASAMVGAKAGDLRASATDQAERLRERSRAMTTLSYHGVLIAAKTPNESSEYRPRNGWRRPRFRKAVCTSSPENTSQRRPCWRGKPSGTRP